MTIESAH